MPQHHLLPPPPGAAQNWPRGRENWRPAPRALVAFTRRFGGGDAGPDAAVSLLSVDPQLRPRSAVWLGVAVNSARLVVGRLLEIRADAGYRTAADVDALFDEIEREVAHLPPQAHHLTVVDWRRCPVMAPEAADRIAARIASTNARTERSATLASSEAPVALLQFLRVIREAGLPSRKLFFDAGQLQQWLDEVLTPPESHRLREFLDESQHARGGFSRPPRNAR
jgi:hypothetical protein